MKDVCLKKQAFTTVGLVETWMEFRLKDKLQKQDQRLHKEKFSHSMKENKGQYERCHSVSTTLDRITYIRDRCDKMK
ncbi:unnamed protein product [Cuscuta campestris]|uniref:Uncharacterized protein n=1 Tax=Cuscuta campestris TaxID=132261 RepID=A0A484M8V3_9ASTE|nr:unnamed protein product [Cuscuta campestris]